MTVNLKLLTAEIVGTFVLIALALFLPAGTILWPAGWAFLILFFAFTVLLTLWLLKHSPGLVTERMTGLGKSDVKTWDKVFFVVLYVLFFAWLVAMPLDAVRFRWSQVPAWLQLVGAILLLSSFYLYFLIFRENAYLSPAVRIQSERRQKVVSTGPYQYVRHPMYATTIIFVVGTSLLLGSLYGLLFGLILVVAIAFRAVREEEILRLGLPGYDDYMAKVKYRLIPHVW